LGPSGRQQPGSASTTAADSGRFDIVFLDPPFDSNLLSEVAGRLEDGNWLAPAALIYVECAARNGLPPLPTGWTVTKAKEAGEVGYHLLTRNLRGLEGE
jgi:16S rRNA (guanine966-N2)-methyltransferase